MAKQMIKSNHLSILGIGRCPIGLLKKNIIEDQRREMLGPMEISFTHHYILNPLTCIQPEPCKETRHCLDQFDCVPSFDDQIFCLQDIPNYQICMIEIFPPSMPYIQKDLKISACFESLTSELEDFGFCAPKQNSSAAQTLEDYICNLSCLVEKIKIKNPEIKIILLNSELLFDQEKNKLSSPLMHPIMDRVKTRILDSHDNIFLLDINDGIRKLSQRGVAFYETEFPLFYIRHDETLTPIQTARDCKHASPRLRKYFTQTFYRQLLALGYNISLRTDDPFTGPVMPETYKKRAMNFLSACHRQAPPLEHFIETFKDARQFSLYIEYVIETDFQNGHRQIKAYTDHLADTLPGSGEDLVTYLYHIRTLAAYFYKTRICTPDPLCQIALRLLSLPNDTHSQYITYVLLWLKHIGMVVKDMILADPMASRSNFQLLIGTLKQKDHLQTHGVVKLLINAN